MVGFGFCGSRAGFGFCGSTAFDVAHAEADSATSARTVGNDLLAFTVMMIPFGFVVFRRAHR
jgi:hypothetical protein